MLKKTILSVAVIAASVSSVSAFAADQFVNFGINGAYTDFSNASLENYYVPNANQPYYKQFNTKTKSVGYGATLGYEYALVPSFRIGAELGYTNLGKETTTINQLPNGNFPAEDQLVKIKQHMFTLLATADYFVTPSWNFIGKVGPAWVSQSANIGITADDGPPNNGSVGYHKTHKVAPYINLGTAYHFDNISVGVSYGHLFGSKIKSLDDLIKNKKVLSSNSVQLNLGYAFPI